MTLSTKYDPLIRDAAARYKVDPRLVKAMCAKEDPTFNPAAIREEPQIGDASVGLMQVTVTTAQHYRPGIGREGLKDPAVNLDIGTHYLADLLARAGGDWWRAVSAYNGGWRPELGFGTVLKAPRIICLAWKPTAPTSGRTIERDCAKPYSAKAGEFGNQPYVTDVANLVNQVSREWNNLPPSTTAGSATTLGVAVGGVVALAGLAWILTRGTHG